MLAYFARSVVIETRTVSSSNTACRTLDSWGRPLLRMVTRVDWWWSRATARPCSSSMVPNLVRTFADQTQAGSEAVELAAYAVGQLGPERLVLVHGVDPEHPSVALGRGVDLADESVTVEHRHRPVAP